MTTAEWAQHNVVFLDEGKEIVLIVVITQKETRLFFEVGY